MKLEFKLQFVLHPGYNNGGTNRTKYNMTRIAWLESIKLKPIFF
jgi:hypothetical protein